MPKESRVEIPSGSGNFYRYAYEDGRTVYRGPVGSAPDLAEEEFMAAFQFSKESKFKRAFKIMGIQEDTHHETGLGDVDYEVMSDPPRISLWMSIDNPLSDFDEEAYLAGEYEVSRSDAVKMAEYFENNYKDITFDPSHLDDRGFTVWFTIEPTMPPEDAGPETVLGVFQRELNDWFQGEIDKALHETGANSFRNNFLIYGQKLEFD